MTTCRVLVGLMLGLAAGCASTGPSERVGAADGPRAVASPSMVNPPTTGTALLAVDVTTDPHRPRIPSTFNVPGSRYAGVYRICVDQAGAVSSIDTRRSAGAREIDQTFRAAIATWRYRPLELGQQAVPFCYSLRLAVNGPPGSGYASR